MLYMAEKGEETGYGLNRKSREFRSLRAAADFVITMTEGSGLRFVGVRRVTYEDLSAKESEIFKYLAEVG